MIPKGWKSIFSYSRKAYTTRLFLLGLDTFGTLVGYVFASYWVQPVPFHLHSAQEIFLTIVGIIIPLWVSFKIFRPYSIILRFIGEKDVYTVFKSLSLAFGFLFVFELLFPIVDRLAIFNSLNIMLGYLVSLLLLVSFRFGIKKTYGAIYGTHSRNINVAIFGAGQSGMITKRAIDNDGKSKYRVVAFFDDNEAVIRKLIEGVEIYHPSEFPEIARKYNIKKGIIAIQVIHPQRKKEFGDLCLQSGVIPLVVPPADTWIDGNFSTGQLREFKLEDLLNRPPIEINKENISNYLHQRTILVSGAAGSIGSEICRQVLNYQPKALIIIDNAETPLVEIEIELLAKKSSQTELHTLIADITFKERCRQAFQRYQPDVVFHAAAYKHVPMMENNPAEAVRVNVLGTKNLADLAVEYRVNKFVMVSTDKAVNPTNVMGASKRIAEIYTQAYNGAAENPYTSFITTRFGNVLGSNGSVVPRFKKQLENGGPITVTHPEITRYFMTIPEACQLVLEAGSIGMGGEIFLFDMGKPVKIVDLAKNMIRLAGKQVDVDIKIEFTGLRPGEKLYEELLNDAENTTPTHNPSILRANIRQQDYRQVAHDIEKLILCSFTGSDMEIVQQMKRIVPEFVSNASKFEVLDKKKPVA